MSKITPSAISQKLVNQILKKKNSSGEYVFIHHPSNFENYSAISQKLIGQNKKKMLFWTTYFYTFLPILGLKFKIPIAREVWQ